MISMTKCGAKVNAYLRDSYHVKADIKEGGGGFNLQSPHAVRKWPGLKAKCNYMIELLSIWL